MYAQMSIADCDSTFKLIKELSGANHGQQWTVKAYESSDDIKIYVKNVYGLFDPQGELRSWKDQLSFRVSSEGEGIQVVHDKEKNPKEGGFGPAGGFALPHKAAQSLWSTVGDVHFIDPVKISEDEIELTIPKYKSGSIFHDWWNRKRFSVWTMSLD